MYLQISLLKSVLANWASSLSLHMMLLSGPLVIMIFIHNDVIMIFKLCILFKKILLLHSNVFSVSLLAEIPVFFLTGILVKLCIYFERASSFLL